jgi:hypothetical protein
VANSSSAPAQACPEGHPAARLQPLTANDVDDAHYSDLAFGEMGLTASVVQEAAFGQPAPVFNAELDGQVLALTQNSASPLQLSPGSHAEWISDDYLAYLRQSVKHGTASPGLSWTDDLETEEGDCMIFRQ